MIVQIIECVRFIPACAGNTPDSPERNGTKSGLSPRVRGTPQFPVIHHRFHRFIPACAGNTLHVRQIIDVGEVYPRVCGEHRITSSPICSRYGLSPRVRGTHAAWQTTESRKRFIPACAGNTGSFLLRAVQIPVYPRVCGEHPTANLLMMWLIGLSPRVRGTRRYLYETSQGWRFIPACAGNTFLSSITNSPVSVYPRVCGEHSKYRDLFYNIFSRIKNPTDFSTPVHIYNSLIINR